MIPRFRFANGYEISRIIKGGWHLAGDHAPIDPQQALADMAQFVEAGITTFDCADIYTGVESLIGDFRAAYPSLAPQVQVHTKYVPDLSDLASLTRADIERHIDRSIRRLRVERLDVVQFHWWDFAAPGYVEVALELQRLQRAGKIAHVSATNFDVAHLQELMSAGVEILTHQVQYSLIDDRPERGMVALCRGQGAFLLCYGSVAGGFMSERWLGVPAPADISNRSLIKYQLVIDDFGGWDLFQDLLKALDAVARKHGADIATVASRYVIDRPQVAAAIIGATNTKHLASHLRIGALALDDEDKARIGAVLALRHPLEGDVYELERDRDGRHGRIMKYELNSLPATGA
jgi:aryl-alcohol dehydrogenase-like predicted oxidoreductase